MLGGLVKYFHHLFNPHCEHCKVLNTCSSCDTLKEMLEFERYERKRLQDALLNITNPKPIIREVEETKPEPIKPKYIPWRVRQQMLEAQDRMEAQLQARRAKEDQKIETLEKEMGIDDASEKREAI